MDGIMRCSRYSFGPNRLHYCGPDANSELWGYIQSGEADAGLGALLKEFKTLYPYLKKIAEANNIKDPFDARVVEAYWLGNELLENVGKKNLHDLLVDNLEARKKMQTKEWRWVEEKITQGAAPHHSFQVLNFWMQKGGRNEKVAQKLEGLSECCVTSGEVLAVNGADIIVLTEPIVYLNGKLALGQPVRNTLTRQLQAEYDIEQVKPGEIVSIHWSVPCEVITKEQAAALKKYTLQNLALANQTI